jgi:c-di-GMP-binding flagellar brake protein YcgR
MSESEIEDQETLPEGDLTEADSDSDSGDAEVEAKTDGQSDSDSEAATEEKSEAEKAAEERRKTYRLNKVLGATLSTTEGETKTTRLFVIDISATGFRATDHQPPDEDECDISIVLVKGQEPFISRMRVVWVKELTVSGMYQMGCEFLETAPEQSAKLEAFIEAERGHVVQTKKISFDTPWTMI